MNHKGLFIGTVKLLVKVADKHNAKLTLTSRLTVRVNRTLVFRR